MLKDLEWVKDKVVIRVLRKMQGVVSKGGCAHECPRVRRASGRVVTEIVNVVTEIVNTMYPSAKKLSKSHIHTWRPSMRIVLRQAELTVLRLIKCHAN